MAPVNHQFKILLDSLHLLWPHGWHPNTHPLDHPECNLRRDLLDAAWVDMSHTASPSHHHNRQASLQQLQILHQAMVPCHVSYLSSICNLHPHDFWRDAISRLCYVHVWCRNAGLLVYWCCFEEWNVFIMWQHVHLELMARNSFVRPGVFLLLFLLETQCAGRYWLY